MKCLAYIATGLGIIGTLFGAWFYIVSTFASAEELKEVRKRLDYKIASDQYLVTQERIWKIDDRYKGKQKEPTVEEEYRQLQEQKFLLREEMNAMTGQTVSKIPAKK